VGAVLAGQRPRPVPVVPDGYLGVARPRRVMCGRPARARLLGARAARVPGGRLGARSDAPLSTRTRIRRTRTRVGSRPGVVRGCRPGGRETRNEGTRYDKAAALGGVSGQNTTDRRRLTAMTSCHSSSFPRPPRVQRRFVGLLRLTESDAVHRRCPHGLGRSFHPRANSPGTTCFCEAESRGVPGVRLTQEGPRSTGPRADDTRRSRACRRRRQPGAPVPRIGVSRLTSPASIAWSRLPPSSLK
jgi:hypothetical protein